MFSSLNRYYRHRTDDGARVPNPFFDRCDDWLVHSAILYLELEEERSRANWQRCDNEVKRKEAERG
jgi:hypothetical protein